MSKSTQRIAHCYFCGRGYGSCVCRWDWGTSEETARFGFEFEGFVITKPNVCETGFYFVDPEEYYGESYLQWMRDRAALVARIRVRCAHVFHMSSDARFFEADYQEHESPDYALLRIFYQESIAAPTLSESAVIDTLIVG
jgi:hypothetical protein